MFKKLILITALLFALITPSFSATLLPYPKFKAFDTSGNPLSGGKLYTYYPGTTTPKPAYSDKDITIQHTNPIILDSVGECDLYLSGKYKLVLKTTVDSLVWTMDNLPTNELNSTEVFAVDYMDGQSGRPTYATWLASPTTTDVILSINAAIDSLTTGTVILPSGTLRITSPILMKNAINLTGMGIGSTIIKNYGIEPAISFNGTAGSYIKKCKVSELKIEDNGSGTDGIYMKYSVDNTIERVWILSAGQHGIHLDMNCWNNNIVRDYIDLAVGKGIYVGQECNANNITYNFINRCDIAIYLSDEGAASCAGNRIAYNTLEASTTGHIYVYQQMAAVFTMLSNKIIGNSSEGTAPYVIKVDSSQAWPYCPAGTVMRDNFISSTSVGGTYVDLNTCDTPIVEANTFYSGVDVTAHHIDLAATTVNAFIAGNKNGGSGTALTAATGATYKYLDPEGSDYLANIYPVIDNTYYLGKNDDDSPLAWKGVILKDTTNGKYYRIEIINGVVTPTDLTD